MAGKRAASNYLTDRNWDQEEEPEEAGTFAKAGDQDLQQRKIKIAKRRKPQEEGSSVGVFKGFSFGAGNVGSNSAPKIVFDGSSTASKADKNGAFNDFSKGKVVDSVKSNGNSVTSVSSSKQTSEKRAQYLANLKNLNEGFRKWVCEHLDGNTLVDLTPVCKDYIRHMERIEKLSTDLSSSESNSSTARNTNPFTVTSAVPLGKIESHVVDDVVSFKTSSKDKEVDNATDASVAAEKSVLASAAKNSFNFSIGQQKSGDALLKENENEKPSNSATPFSFTFGQQKSDDKTSSNERETEKPSKLDEPAMSNFVFGAKPPGSFAFGSFQKQGETPTTVSAATEGDEEYVPPVAEHKVVEEEGALYMQRCKLFYQKNGQWLEKGLGNLHLKAAGDKTQLIIRADTSLGNILLNIILQPQMKFKTQGKKRC